MLAISLNQPYASCVALGYKRVETRSWGNRLRGPIAIHAAKAWGREQREAFYDLAGLDVELPAKLHLGCVVAVAELVDVFRIGDDMDKWERLAPAFSDEEELGLWTQNRYGWCLDSVRPLDVPYPLKGQQRLWSLKEDDEEAVRALARDPLVALPW